MAIQRQSVPVDLLATWPADTHAWVLAQLDPDDPVPFVVSPAASVLLRGASC